MAILEFLLVILILVYVYLSVKAIKRLDKKVDNQEAFIKEYIEGQNVLHRSTKKETQTVDTSDT